MRRPAHHLIHAANAFRRRVRSSEMLLLLVCAVLGIACALIAIGLGQAARGIQRLLYGLARGEHLSAVDHVEALRLLALPLGGVLIGLWTWAQRRRHAPVDVVEANALHGGRIPAKDSATVVVQTVVSNGVGASVGLEAAYAQAGGGLASLLGQRLKLRRNDLRSLVAAGSGAAVSAAFGAPLTGAFYAFEVVLGAYVPASIAPVMLAAITAAVSARGLGETPYVIAAGGMHPIGTTDYALYALLGLICGLLGIALMRSVSLIEHWIRRSPLPRYWGPAVGGLLLVPLALISPEGLSGGHGALNLTLISEVTLASLAIAIFIKFAASAISLGFGFRGGLFFASLFLGSLVGRLYQVLLAQIPNSHVLAPDDATMVGMAALAVAVIGAPMTISLLVLEVTHDFGITSVAIAASLISATLARVAFGYNFSTWRMHLRGETIHSARDVGWVRLLTPGRLMRRDARLVRANATLADFRAQFPLGSVGKTVLTGPDGSYAGILRTADAWSTDLPEDAPIGRIARLPDVALTPDMPLDAVMSAFDRHEADDLAVVSADGRVLGVLSERHVRRRYAEELERSQRELFGEA